MRTRKKASRPTERFTAIVLDGHKGLAFEAPFDPAALWGVEEVRLRPGRRGYLVRCRMKGRRFESAVVPRSRRFWVLVSAEMRKAGGLRAGTEIRVSIEPA